MNQAKNIDGTKKKSSREKDIEWEEKEFDNSTPYNVNKKAKKSNKRRNSGKPPKTKPPQDVETMLAIQQQEEFNRIYNMMDSDDDQAIHTDSDKEEQDMELSGAHGGMHPVGITTSQNPAEKNKQNKCVK